MAFSTITMLDVDSAQAHSHDLRKRLLATDSSTYAPGPTGTAGR